MVMTASNMMDLGSSAPEFELKNTEGSFTKLTEVKGDKATVVMFICNHCPYVIHIAPQIAKMAKAYASQGVQFIAINSNDTETYPADSFENMIKEKAARGYNFPYLIDADQSVAKAYDAACTPDIYAFDANLKLVYRGQFDASRPHRISSGNYDSSVNPSTGKDLSQALDAIVAGKPVPTEQLASIGCNIKWKVGNEPS
ncbi:alkyl hydroperoxide reductase [Catenovulum maritimum]|uniref:Alkyl hydroperoxide reductase n=2 Tax=Catenovulum maritimum TaxID=1513271 RepID=A0A0J8GTI5_9ALTE|nr:alkyl hydroperoxide reductase [Catenovulum maritimum]